MSRKKIYISGKISGRPADEATYQFYCAEQELIAKGWSVVNPIMESQHLDYAGSLT